VAVAEGDRLANRFGSIAVIDKPGAKTELGDGYSV